MVLEWAEIPVLWDQAYMTAQAKLFNGPVCIFALHLANIDFFVLNSVSPG